METEKVCSTIVVEIDQQVYPTDTASLVQWVNRQLRIQVENQIEFKRGHASSIGSSIPSFCITEHPTNALIVSLKPQEKKHRESPSISLPSIPQGTERPTSASAPFQDWSLLQKALPASPLQRTNNSKRIHRALIKEEKTFRSRPRESN